jgi:hypothetical protein
LFYGVLGLLPSISCHESNGVVDIYDLLLQSNVEPAIGIEATCLTASELGEADELAKLL